MGSHTTKVLVLLFVQPLVRFPRVLEPAVHKGLAIGTGVPVPMVPCLESLQIHRSLSLLLLLFPFLESRSPGALLLLFWIFLKSLGIPRKDVDGNTSAWNPGHPSEDSTGKLREECDGKLARS